jgi:hypothetical protein
LKIAGMIHVVKSNLLPCHYCQNASNYSYCSKADAYHNPSHPAGHR